jgi:exopolysaccharide biosynthesis polyprenyl glycosylphosphotransferase
MSSKAVETIRAKPLGEPSLAEAGISSLPLARVQLFAPILDFVALCCISALVYALASNASERALPQSEVLAFGFTLCLVQVLACKRFGLYAPLPVDCVWSELKLLLKAGLLTQLLAMSALYLARSTAVTPPVLLALGIVSPLWLMAARQMRSAQTEQRIAAGLLTRNVLIIGHGDVGCALRDHLQGNVKLGYVVRGFLDDNSRAHDILGTTADLERIIRAHFIDQVYITTHSDRDLVKTLTMKAPQLGVDVSIVPDLFDGIGWNAPVDRVGHFPVLVLHRRHAYALQRLVKRILDITGAIVGTVLTAPFLFLIAALIKLESPGPVFYKATRVGCKGRIFQCFKFRTMYEGSDQQVERIAHLNERSAPLFKVKNDPRVTPLGRILRRYSFDELPQLANVLLGEMSLVGPRPPSIEEYRQFKLEHLRKLDVMPGITGLWQVTARSDPSFQSYIRCDLEYIEHWSLSLDIEILIRTCFEVLRGTGV